jgi:Zn ribbon nucleic-acid-binding protein
MAGATCPRCGSLLKREFIERDWLWGRCDVHGYSRKRRNRKAEDRARKAV